MEYRFLGPTGIKVSVISFGNWLNSNTAAAEANTIACVKTAWDLGINYFDTAEIYGHGEAQRQMGKALKALNVPRHKYVVSTKIFSAEPTPIPNVLGLSRKHIIEGIKNSLSRLGLDYVDVVFCHRFDLQTPMLQTCKAMDWVVRKGYAHYWGTSEWNPEEIAQAHYLCEMNRLTKPVVQQPQYNMFNRQKMEIGYSRLFEGKKLGTTIWSPLVGGILTGKYQQSLEDPQNRLAKFPNTAMFYDRYLKNNREQTIAKITKLDQIAKQLGCNLAQLAMAWCIKYEDVSTAITGASRPQQLQDIVGAIGVYKKLTPQYEKKIEEAIKTQPQGQRQTKNFENQKSRRASYLQKL